VAHIVWWRTVVLGTVANQTNYLPSKKNSLENQQKQSNNTDALSVNQGKVYANQE